MRSGLPVVCIVTPGTRTANNGNWRTAVRWASMLRGSCRPILQTQWDGTPADALIALHAKRSAESIARWRAARGPGGLGLVMTGTDLYRDLPSGDPQARESIATADRLVVLQEEALRGLPASARHKTEVVFQSAPPLPWRAPSRGPLRIVVVGHLRAEKDPATLFDAIRRLPPALDIAIRHIGAPLDATLGAAARALAQIEPRYRYLGALPHGLARAAIQRAHLLAHPSLMEGGANVIVEAIMSGTAVVASRMAGNVGMLGRSYPGYFPVGDASGLAALLAKAGDTAFRSRLQRACRERRPLFRPATERAAVRRLAARLVQGER